jgi:hypothetical protein
MTYALPIEGTCRHCGGELMLSELLANRDGRCPRCTTLLSPDWTEVLLDQASQAERSERVLIQSLRRLVGLPGNLVLLPHSVFDALLEEVGWEQKMAKEQPELLAEEVRHARLALEEWEDLKPPTDTRSLARRLASLAAHLRRSANETEAAS